MKIRTKVFYHKDEAGKFDNLENHKVILIVNGKVTDTTLQDVFTDLEFDDNEVYGNSLLSFYSLLNGNLVEKGSNIQWAIADTLEPIIITAIERPVINDDTNIPFEHVQKFAEFFQLEKPDEVFLILSEEEKQYFIDQRSKAANNTAKPKEQEEELAKKKEQELKASIDPRYVQNKKDYLSTQSFYRSMDGFKEYINGCYHLFHGSDNVQEDCVLIKRGMDWWEEPKDIQVMDSNDKTVTVEFTDGAQLKNIVLDIPTGETTVSDAVASE